MYYYRATSFSDYTERRARLNTIDLPTDVVATPRRAARTSSQTSTFYMTLDEHGKTNSYSSLQDAMVEIVQIKHHSQERDREKIKKNKFNKFVHKMGKIFTSTEKSETEQSYHSKQSSVDQSSIFSNDQVDYIQEVRRQKNKILKNSNFPKIENIRIFWKT